MEMDTRLNDKHSNFQGREKLLLGFLRTVNTAGNVVKQVKQ
jgi:hypothetical protein